MTRAQCEVDERYRLIFEKSSEAIFFTLQEDVQRKFAEQLHEQVTPTLAAIGLNIEVASRALVQHDWKEMAGVSRLIRRCLPTCQPL